MDIIAHLAFGLWLWKFYGNFWGLIASVLFDIDHILGFLYDRVKKQKLEIPKIYQLVYRRRSWFHSIAMIPIFTFIFSFITDWKIVFIGLSSHLILDALDKSGIYILPFLYTKKIKGPLPPSYFIDNPHSNRKSNHIPSLLVAILFLILIILG